MNEVRSGASGQRDLPNYEWIGGTTCGAGDRVSDLYPDFEVVSRGGGPSVGRLDHYHCGQKRPRWSGVFSQESGCLMRVSVRTA
jgi:hypothetical protein